MCRSVTVSLVLVDDEWTCIVCVDVHSRIFHCCVYCHVLICGCLMREDIQVAGSTVISCSDAQIYTFAAQHKQPFRLKLMLFLLQHLCSLCGRISHSWVLLCFITLFIHRPVCATFCLLVAQLVLTLVKSAQCFLNTPSTGINTSSDSNSLP